IRRYFPKTEIGTSDVVDESSPWIDELVNWTDVYQQITGEPFAFFQADVSWSRPATRNLAALASAMKARHVPFGVMYDGDDESSSNEAWTETTLQHVAEIESTIGLHPDTAIFKTGFRYPSRLLPETQPGTATHLALQYVLAPPSITM